jgi:iron complex outermembrane receptor protein
MASVIINPGNYSTETALDGGYRIAEIPNGTYKLTVTSAISEKNEQEITITKGQEVELNIDVLPLITEFEEIAILSKSLGLTDRTPYNVTKLEVKDVSFKGSPSGIMGQLQREPGVNAAEMGQGIVKPFIRGLGFSRVATVYQGAKFENHQWGADHGLGLNDLEIESVDVIKGPSSVLYGSGALGGVIVMNDDKPYLKDTALQLSVGTTYNSVSNGMRGYATLGQQFKNNWYVAGAGAYENHADYYDGNQRIIGNSRFNSTTGRFHVGYTDERMSHRLSFSGSQQYLGIIDDNEMEEAESLATTRNDRSMQLPFQEVTDYLVSYSSTFSPNDHWNTSANVSYHLNLRKEIEDDFNDIDLGLTQQHLFYNFRAEQSKHNHFTNTFGVQGSVVDMKNMLEAEEILIPNALYNEVGVYYLNTYKKKSHTVQGAVRVDYRNLIATAEQENIVEEGYILPGNPVDRSLGVDYLGLTG